MRRVPLPLATPLTEGAAAPSPSEPSGRGWDAPSPEGCNGRRSQCRQSAWRAATHRRVVTVLNQYLGGQAPWGEGLARSGIGTRLPRVGCQDAKHVSEIYSVHVMVPDTGFQPPSSMTNIAPQTPHLQDQDFW